MPTFYAQTVIARSDRVELVGELRNPIRRRPGTPWHDAGNSVRRRVYSVRNPYHGPASGRKRFLTIDGRPVPSGRRWRTTVYVNGLSAQLDPLERAPLRPDTEMMGQKRLRANPPRDFARLDFDPDEFDAQAARMMEEDTDDEEVPMNLHERLFGADEDHVAPAPPPVARSPPVARRPVMGRMNFAPLPATPVEVSETTPDCILCYDAPRSVVFAPCGHRVACQDCARPLWGKPCPICRVACRPIVIRDA